MRLNRSDTSDELVLEVLIDGESLMDKETQSESTMKIRKLSAEDNSIPSVGAKKLKKRKISDFHQF